jgi:protease I
VLAEGTRVAVLVEEEFDETQVTGIADGLRHAGATVTFVGPFGGRTYHDRRGQTAITTDAAAGALRLADVHAIVIPGGYAPDRIRMRHAMVDLVRDAMRAGVPVGAICHGPQVLISAQALRGRTLTCWPSIAIDVKNAGGLYVDRPVVEDGNLITSRKSDDVARFVEALTAALSRVR